MARQSQAKVSSMPQKATESKPAHVQAPVVLIWNMPRVLLVQVPVAADRSHGRSVSKPIRINPGANQISAEAWATLQSRKKIAELLRKGALRLVSDQGGMPLKRIPRTLENMGNDEAVALVENTMDESQLQAWAKTETREEISKAIARQIEALEAAVPPKEGKE